ncbi:hypothetical protein D3C71_1535630 [compost metagenome]
MLPVAVVQLASKDTGVPITVEPAEAAVNLADDPAAGVTLRLRDAPAGLFFSRDTGKDTAESFVLTMIFVSEVSAASFATWSAVRLSTAGPVTDGTEMRIAF